MPISRFDLINRRGQIRGLELERLQREAVSSRELSMPAGSLQSSSGVALPLPVPAVGGDIFAKITSATTDANGMYPAVLESWSAATLTWTDGAAIKVLPANSETLANGTRYEVVFLDTLAGTPVYGTVVAVGPAFTEAKVVLSGDVTLSTTPSVVLSISLPLGNWMLWTLANLSMGSGTAAGDGIQLQLWDPATPGQITNMDTYLVTQVAGGTARLGAFVMTDYLNNVAPFNLQLRAQCTGSGGNNKVLSSASGSNTYLGYFN